MNFSIRDATVSDAATIADFNARMAEETEGRTLDPDIIGPGVAAILTDQTKGRYWVATSGETIIGQLMVTYEWSDWRNRTIWWIQSVYVASEFRREGVFSALYRHVESLSDTEPGVCGLRLYVEDNNQQAQRTYEALGMVKPNYLVMESILSEDN
jgi:ribosomal protein S18 acetylase RimI-like enzyme